jgi:hypothetical protein
MGALRITETTGKGYASQTPGTMHACDHDGHTAMLLGAAKLLAEEGGFDGTARFIFQPAAEWGKGALAMLDDDLMERFRRQMPEMNLSVISYIHRRSLTEDMRNAPLPVGLWSAVHVQCFSQSARRCAPAWRQS